MLAPTAKEARMAAHPTVPVRLGHFVVDIDVEIAPLVALLHRAGITTMQSCQDLDGRVWLMLASTSDLAALLAAVGKPSSNPSSLYRRVRNEAAAAPHVRTDPDQWRYALAPYPLEDRLWPQHWDFEVTVDFPRTDLAEVTQRVEEFGAQGRTEQPPEPGPEPEHAWSDDPLRSP
jgi:hypothetical protein